VFDEDNPQEAEVEKSAMHFLFWNVNERILNINRCKD
jgi:hypothetical protein